MERQYHGYNILVFVFLVRIERLLLIFLGTEKISCTVLLYLIGLMKRMNLAILNGENSNRDLIRAGESVETLKRRRRVSDSRRETRT